LDKHPVAEPIYSSAVNEVVVETAPEIVSDLAVRQSSALVADVRQAKEYLRHTKSASTLKAYQDDWKRFQTWATSRGVIALPASPDVVSTHLGWLAAEGYSISIIGRFLSAAGHYHQEANCVFPRNDPLVAKMFKGIRQRVGVKQTKKTALELGPLIEVCKRLRVAAESRPDETERIPWLRQRAILTVGWFCMLRSANLVAIRRGHVRLVRLEGIDPIDDINRPNGLILHLPKSKTDQLQEGRDVAAHAQAEEAVCPVRALVEYLHASSFAPEDLIFPVSERTVTRLVKKLVANPAHDHKSLREIDRCPPCSESARRFGSHSLRRGSATTQAKQGVPQRQIMRQGGWKSEKVMHGYVEDATLFENNSTKDLSGKSEPTATPPAPAQALPKKVQVRRRKGWRRRRRYVGEIK
jgi:integrase